MYIKLINVFKMLSTFDDIIPLIVTGLPIIFPNYISIDVKSNARTPRIEQPCKCFHNAIKGTFPR